MSLLEITTCFHPVKEQMLRKPVNVIRVEVTEEGCAGCMVKCEGGIHWMWK